MKINDWIIVDQGNGRWTLHRVGGEIVAAGSQAAVEAARRLLSDPARHLVQTRTDTETV